MFIVAGPGVGPGLQDYEPRVRRTLPRAMWSRKDFSALPENKFYHIWHKKGKL